MVVNLTVLVMGIWGGQQVVGLTGLVCIAVFIAVLGYAYYKHLIGI
jgi:hypothetical protein